MTLSRVLEPEVMDTAEDASDYDAMDHSEVNRLFVEHLLKAGLGDGDILDLGTGTALIPIELCRQWEAGRIMAVDAAIEMLELARIHVEVAGLSERIQVAHVDAKRLPFADRSFQTVMSNSIVHHIPEPLDVLREAVRTTSSGGLIFFRDLLRPDSDELVHQLVETYAANANDHQRSLFDASLRAALDLDEIRSLISHLGFAPDSVQQTSDRHWTWCVRVA